MSETIEKSWENLYEKYPSLFKNLSYVECNEGWYDLISSVCFTINAHESVIENHKKYYPERQNISDYEPFEFTQIKEKFGSLRIYSNGGDIFTQGVIRMAENLSSKICEFTGNSGKIYSKVIIDGEICRGWLKCLCPEKAKEYNYVDLQSS
jgi:hypothetical protein